MDEQIVPKHGDYIMTEGYFLDEMRFSTVVRCNWRSDSSYYCNCFCVEADNGDKDMTVVRESRLDTNMHNGWKYQYMWVAEANRIPVFQQGVN